MNVIRLGLLALTWIAGTAQVLVLASGSGPVLKALTLLTVLMGAFLGLFAAYRRVSTESRA
ncbi:hypothetical protein CKO28_02740 [Rhodovibrio sodomensis]|uniref:Uncharacterized protein n=1 Tax=Rhodovibrio sodomensis TaxID=1088 RepID=A0ABS1D9B7_9PROT|nr:hypothetical protein [Rhodovibrio sodomensis]MBK1666960.1 hypothetical protein [Rhodovibrio sodomensis]